MLALHAIALASSGQPEFLDVLLRVVAAGGVIILLATGSLVLFWKSLSNDPGAAAEKGSERARVNRSYFFRFGVLIAVLLLLCIVIFVMASR